MKVCRSKVRGRNPNFFSTSSERSKRIRSTSSLNLSAMYFSTCSRLTMAFLTGCFMGSRVALLANWRISSTDWKSSLASSGVILCSGGLSCWSAFGEGCRCCWEGLSGLLWAVRTGTRNNRKIGKADNSFMGERKTGGPKLLNNNNALCRQELLRGRQPYPANRILRILGHKIQSDLPEDTR